MRREAVWIHARIGAALSCYGRAAVNRALDAVRASLGAGAFDTTWTSAQAAPWEHHVDEVLAGH